MINERPTITTTYTTVDSVVAPGVSKPCDEYVTQPINMNYTDDHPFVGSFVPEDNIYLSKTNNDTMTPSYIFLNINVIDPIASNYSVRDAVYRLYAYDSSTAAQCNDSPFGESLYYRNKFVLANHLVYRLGYFRKIRNTLEQSLFSFTGFSRKYTTLPYIDSIIQNTPMGPSNDNDVTIRINPRSFIIEEEQEQRNDTIISIFGTIAAFYSSMVFIYVFLFGVDLMKPWGIAHERCCGFRKLEEGIQETLINVVSPPKGDMEARINILEEFNRFLRENVIDLSLLEKEWKKRMEKERKKRMGKPL
ncbi:hypothetical protein C1645_818523 [Glomus cerebriforme]|uniref:Uncharacterized protein n=1 Tax=Glomus cerebriforme TaxID=658196 RepID=A0A397T9W7_9GLOM|nr:hypothetical protein C1645_818523 [Glomus cerebriforme]